MSSEKSKDKKKDKLPPLQVIRYNLFMLKKVARFTPQYILLMVVVGIIGGISSSVATVFTYALFNALDTPGITFGTIVLYLVLIIGTNFALSIFGAWYFQYYHSVMDRRLQHKMHEELFEQALKMDLACYDDPAFYNDYVWAMDESKGRAEQVLEDTERIITYLITLSTLITLMMQVDILVGGILLLGCIINAVMWELENKIWFKRNEKIKPYGRKRSYVNRIYHLSDHAKELRVSSAGDNLETMYSDSIDKIIEEEIKSGKKIYLIRTLDNFVSITVRFLPVVLLLAKLYDGTAQLGGFVASINIIWNLNWSMYDLAKNILRMQDNAQYIGKYLKFLSYTPEITDGPLTAEPLESIELRGVSFAYSANTKNKENTDEEKEIKYSLKDVNLKINQGEKVAIVGYNGAGKTTLTKLIMRLYDPTEGEILYNGKPLTEYKIPSLRSRIGTVFQDYKIFAANIAENVMGGEVVEEGDRETVTDALTKATFSDKLSSLEMGIDTELTKEFSEDGTELSGGEAQKVAIARIFARPYELLIMDEPSSALDPIAEYKLNHTILEYTKDKTVIFISHRLSTTRMADRILMFDSGQLIEDGSHEDLMKKGGKYAEMFRLQAEKYRM
ncbi:MAG: ABC transporter ATP-binding protein [Clostridia bacterium]|nr:ABC transporter ATP-binding protein [Clostridia bacterium]